MTRCHDLQEVRDNIDRLDKQILELIGERSGFVREAARLKARREEIVDRPRIESIIVRVRKLAEEYGLAPDIAETVYRNMIDGFIEFEGEEFDRLHDKD